MTTTRVSARHMLGLAGVLCAMALLASPASAARPDAKAIWGPVTIDGKSQFPLYHRLGVGIYEIGLNWAAVAPTRPRDPKNPNDPAYLWPTGLNEAVHQARIYHMHVMIQVIFAPPWVNGGRGQNYAPTRPGDLAAFFTAAARRYPTVHLWMVWGEPSRGQNFQPLTKAPPRAKVLTRAQASAPHLYARLLDASYGALKAIDRHDLVIGGNTFTSGDISPAQWIENLRLPNGRPPRMDLYGHNPFCLRAPNLANPPSAHGWVDFSDLGRFSKLIDRYLAPRHGHLRLFLSEWTIPTAVDDEFNFHVTLPVQAAWIRDAFRIVRRDPSLIYALGWIHLRDEGAGGSKGGLLFESGKPKPGFDAFEAG